MLVKIGFSDTPEVISKIVERVIGAKFSHAYFVIFTTELGTLVYQADASGPSLTSMAEFRKSHTIVYELTPAIDLSQAVSDSISKYIGDGYDYTGDIGTLLEDVGAGKRWADDFHRPGCENCSALVVRTMQLARDPVYPGADKLVAVETDPKQLFDFLVAAAKSAAP